MPFRSNKPARLEKRTDGSASKDDWEHQNPRSPKRQSVQQLTHSQLVTRQRQLLSQQKNDKQGSDQCLTPTTTSFQCLAAKASSTSVNNIVSTIESRIERVDVEKAIELLQELKKSASPDELVALHKALLPTKEEKPTQAPQLPPIDELAYTAAPQDRTRSSIPPGLATRSGGSNDPLRRPSETTSSKTSHESEIDWFVDTDKRRTQASSHQRVNTLDQTSYHAGAFQTGTLRITNGAASPEPSIISKLATESDDKEVDEEHEATSSPQKKPLRKRMTMAVLGPRKLPDEQANKRSKKRSTIADKPSQLEQVSAPVLPKFDFAQSRDDLNVFSSGRRSSMGDLNRKSNRGYLVATLGSADFSKDLELPQVVEPRAQSFDFGPRSQIRKELQLDPPLQQQSFQHIPTEESEDVPRFQQRWGHRASHLSGQHVTDPDLARSPRDKSGLLEFATRLSTVDDEDEEQAEEETCMSHAHTLSRLTGVDVEADDAQRLSNEADADQSPCAPRSKIVRKKDSGYCSDATQPSTCQNEQPSTADTTTTGLEQSRQTVAPDADTSISKDSSEADTEAGGFVTFEDMMSPVRRSETVLGPSPQSDSKKSSRSLFKSKSSRKQSFNVLNVQKGAAPNDEKSTSSTPQTSSDDSRPPLNHKKSKKLQKPIPEAVRHQRKKTVENIKAMPVQQQESSDVSTEQCLIPGGFNDSQRRLSVADDGEDSKSLFSRKRGKSFSRKRSKTLAETNKDSAAPPSEAITPAPSSPALSPDWSRNRSKTVTDTNEDAALPSSGVTTPMPFSPAPSPPWTRSRSKTLTDTNTDRSLPSSGVTTPASSSPAPSPGWSRRRSKSIFNIASVSTPSITSYDPDMEMPSCSISAAVDDMTPDRRDAPMTAPWDSTHASEALTSHPPNALQAKRSADGSKGLHKRYYSLHRASADGATPTTPAKLMEDGKKAESDGEDETSASDIKPAPVTPQVDDTTPVAVGSNCSVEDRFPDWQGRPAVNRASTSPSLLQPLFSAHSRDSSVPALPEMPVDIAAKVARADEMVAKKMKNSPRASPVASARSSIDHVERKRSNLSKKRSSPRENARQAALDKLTASYDRKFDEQKADMSVKELMLNKPRGHVSRWSVDGGIDMPRPEEQAAPTSPTHDSQHPGWPGWEKQSNLWRQRREARPEPLSLDGEISPRARTAPLCEPCDSPAIVVSRYITPLNGENVQHKRNSAIEYAQEYSNLIVCDEENSPSKPNICRADSAFSNVASTMCVTMGGNSDDERPAKLDIMRTGTAGSSFSTTTTTTTTTVSSNWWERSDQSPDGSSVSKSVRHERTKSGRYKAYRPTDAARAERSRALSVARQSTFSSSSESLSIPQQKQASSEDLIDRYSGGLGYAWDRDAGFGGSAGTVKRSSHDNANRKSVKMSEEFGLDLSDVPFFLQKVQKM